MESERDDSIGNGQSGIFAMIRRCLSGDDQAWDGVVKSMERRVFWLMYRFTHCREDAEDLTQETLLRAFRSLHSYRQDEASLQSWIMAVARNLAIDHRRQVRRMPKTNIPDALEQIDLLQEDYRNPLHFAERAELYELVRSGLGRLPGDLRQALQLKYLEEMEYHEIAALLNVAEGTIKSRVSRGRILLARFIKARLQNRSWRPDVRALITPGPAGAPL